MRPRIHQATEEDEDGVRALFEAASLEVREVAWGRTMHPEPPLGFGGSPWIARNDDNGRVLAFVLVRAQNLFHQGNLHRAQILGDFMVAQDDDGLQAGRQLLDVVCQNTSLNLAAGWGKAATDFLRGASWKHVANLPRLVFKPPRRKAKDVKLPPALDPPEDPTMVQSAMAAEGLVFFERPRGADRFMASNIGNERHMVLPMEVEDEVSAPGAFVRLRRVPASEPGAEEWHVVDFRGATEHAKRLPGLLDRLAQAHGQLVHLTFLNSRLKALLIQKGAAELPARWALFARLGDFSMRDVIMTFNAETPWNFFPADFDLDIDQ